MFHSWFPILTDEDKPERPDPEKLAAETPKAMLQDRLAATKAALTQDHLKPEDRAYYERLRDACRARLYPNEAKA